LSPQFILSSFWALWGENDQRSDKENGCEEIYCFHNLKIQLEVRLIERIFQKDLKFGICHAWSFVNA